MISVTYDIKLTEAQFKALKEMVQQHYLTANNCKCTDAEIYDLFNVIKPHYGGISSC